jgi:predicted HicB family RNase H-like nuclease
MFTITQNARIQNSSIQELKLMTTANIKEIIFCGSCQETGQNSQRPIAYTFLHRFSKNRGEGQNHMCTS